MRTLVACLLLVFLLAGCSALKQSVNTITLGIAFQEPDSTEVAEDPEE